MYCSNYVIFIQNCLLKLIVKNNYLDNIVFQIIIVILQVFKGKNEI